MRSHILLLSASVAVAVFIAGCGATDESSKTVSDMNATASSEDVKGVFREIGVNLEVEGRFDGIGALPVGFTSLAPVPAVPVFRRYGQFSIGVFDDVGVALNEGVFGDTDSLPTDVTWEMLPESSCGAETCWVAMKLYGNVQLLWTNSERRLDARWNALDAALRLLDTG